MTCNHGKSAIDCVACYRELAADRSKQVRTLGIENGRLAQEVKDLRAELARLKDPQGWRKAAR